MAMMKSWLAAAAGCAVLVAVPSCQPSSSVGSGKPAESTPAAPAEIGAPLYAGVAMPTLPPSTPVGEPIVIPNALVQNDLRVQVPASVDATIDMIATLVPPGTKIDPNDADILYHPRDLEKNQPYRRLRIGDTLKKGDIFARLDEQLVYLQIESLKQIDLALVEVINSAAEAEKSQKELLDSTQGVAGLSKSDLLERLALYQRYKENKFSKLQEQAKTKGDRESAIATWNRYYCRAPISGRIIRMIKQPGEFAKAGETLIELQSTDRFRVEGKMDAGFASGVRRGMKVYVEPSRPVAPNALTNYHRQEVTSIGVTAHAGRPMIVSGGLDDAVLLWDVTSSKQSFRLSNPTGVGVRALAVTGPKAKGHFIAVGGDDGKVRIWDVTNPDKLPKEPTTTFDDVHAGAVLSVAYSPDGKYLATAAGREVIVWNVADKKKLYTLPNDHRSAVTSLRFTPQATLVTVSQDKSIRTWKLGEMGASPLMLIDHRGGSVDILGVSSDGSRVLFDKDSSRLDVVSLADQRSLGTVQNPGGSARFALSAIFSPDDSQILTVGADNDQKGILTEWDTPAVGNRGSERRQLVTPRNIPVTCAAFSPDSTHKFVAVGTADGGVYFWTQTAGEERGKRFIGDVVSVVPRDARSVDVQVEISLGSDKVGESIQDRSTATIIIPPEGVIMNGVPNVMAPPAAPAPIPAPGVIPAGGVAPKENGVNAGMNMPVVPAGATVPTVTVPANVMPPKSLVPAIPVVPAPAGNPVIPTPGK